MRDGHRFGRRHHFECGPQLLGADVIGRGACDMAEGRGQTGARERLTVQVYMRKRHIKHRSRGPNRRDTDAKRGGGCVTRDRGLDALARNGNVVNGRKGSHSQPKLLAGAGPTGVFATGLHVLPTEATLDTQVARGDRVVRRAGDLDDLVVLDVQLEVAANAAV